MVRLIISTILLILTISCQRNERALIPNRLRIAFQTYPTTTDPRNSADFVSGTLVSMTYEGLTRLRSDGGIDLAIADRVEISSDLLTYTFHLKNSFWSDGTPLTARDFEKSWKKQLSPSFPSFSSYLFYPIKSAEKAYKNLVLPEEIGIKVLDDLTLEVTLERPTPWFLSLTAYASFFPIPVHLEEQYRNWEKNQTGSFVSNGPFCIQNAESNAEIILLKNPRFWNTGKVFLDEIRIAIVGSDATALKLFEQGHLDWVGGAICPLPSESLKILKEKYPLSYHPIAATTFCSFNTSHPLLKNKSLRKALSLSIDRQNLINNILQANEVSATRCIPPALMGRRNKTLYQSFDPEMARLYLDKALKELQITPEILNQLTFSVRSTHQDLQLAQALQRQWNQILGIDISLQQFEQKSFKDVLYRKDYDLALAFWIAQFNDPINILERFVDPANVKNYPGWFHPTFALLVRQSNEAKDNIERTELIEAAEWLLVNEMPFAPIYHWSNVGLAHPKILDLETTPGGAILFEYCRIDPKTL